MTTSTRGSALIVATSNSAARRVALDDIPVVDDAIAVDDAEDAVTSRLERLEAERVGLGDFSCGIDLVVEDDEHALASRLGLGGDAKTFEEIGGAFVSERARIAHRPDDNDGLVAANRQVQEVGGLFERVGSARDDDAGELGVVCEEGIDAASEPEPLLEAEGAARSIGELFGFGADISLDAGHRGHELVGAQPAAGSVGNSAAGGNQPDSRKRGRRRGALARVNFDSRGASRVWLESRRERPNDRERGEE